MNGWKLLALWAALLVANLILAFFRAVLGGANAPEGLFFSAIERSLFQGIALLTVWLL